MKGLKFRKLNKNTVQAYVEYAKKVIASEPFLNEVECVDLQAVLKRLDDGFYKTCNCILAFSGGDVVGRIEYHFYGCTACGATRAYVSWICTLKEARHKGVAQALFKQFENECRKHGVEQYYLIAAENDEAKSFYGAFENAEIKLHPILRKDIVE